MLEFLNYPLSCVTFAKSVVAFTVCSRSVAPYNRPCLTAALACDRVSQASGGNSDRDCKQVLSTVQKWTFMEKSCSEKKHPFSSFTKDHGADILKANVR